MYRSGYSFNVGIGHLDEVITRLSEIGAITAPISDRASTFGFIKWDKAAKKAGMRPVFGVELAVVPELGAAKPITDHVKFMAVDTLKPLNELIGIATANPGSEPSLLYKEAIEAPGVIKIFGERARLEHIPSDAPVFVSLSPAVSKGYYNAVKRSGLPWCAMDANFYPREGDQELYRVMLGRRADTRTYPSHILSEEEWRKAVSFVASENDIEMALHNRKLILDRCVAQLKKAEIFIPEKPFTLREMCVAGAQTLNVNLDNKVYMERMERELAMIASKNFENYFYIIADLIAFAKQHMIVGPARGSSCGSLVCYLLGITTIDPIPYGLIFERFIDINRSDLPDIDIDFSDVNRHLVFEYAEQKYGKDHVARLGTVHMFQPRSAMNQAGASLKIPRWKIERTLEGVIERSSGDSRANNSLEDTLRETPAGKELFEEHPEIMLAARMESHPSHAGQHAAGIVITREPITDVVAVDSRTGATMCDKYDAESYDLLKIDALGLTQLSIQERTLELIGEDPTSAGRFLDKLPLDDPAAYNVLNEQRWPGIFQYTGSALQSLAKQIVSDNIEDIISVTALARPGPLASGGANDWVKRRIGQQAVTYPHPLFEPMLKDSLGLVIYQETVLRIGREIGGLSWEDVTLLRKAMSKSLGKEYFDTFGDRWKTEARKKGISDAVLNKVWNDMTVFGSWAFNRCLSGDTKIKIALPGYRTPKGGAKIKDLYRIYESHQSPWIKGNKRKPVLVSLCPDKRGWPQMATRIIKSGKKLCWAYIFDDGSKVTCTPDHRFIVNGSWLRIGDAKKFDVFASMIYESIPFGFTGAGRKKVWSKGMILAEKKLISKVKVGLKETYDIQMPVHHNFVLQNGLVTHNSHAVAYGMISYQCCYLKAHYPLEFAAATLDAEKDTGKQLQLLRELKREGIGYIPVDIEHSTDRWVPVRKGNEAYLVGPLGAIKGIGPKSVDQIMTARKNGKPIPPGIEKKLKNAVTELDSLYPLADRIKELHPNLPAIGIKSNVMTIRDVQCGVEGAVVIIAVASRIAPRDENDLAKVAKRGRELRGPTWALNMFMKDDTDEIFCKIDRFKYERLAKQIIERGNPGSSIYAIKGTVPRDFRMISIDKILYLGSLKK